MSTIDSQLLHVHRTPACQRRVHIPDHHISTPRVHSSSSRKAMLASRRRHSTPQVSTLRFIEVKSPQSNSVIKHYYINTRSTRVTKEQISKPDLIKSPLRPTTLVKPRHPDERVVRLPTTPTSISSSMDIFLPIAKKNRTTIVETPSPVATELQTINQNTSAKKQWNQREKAYSFDFGSDVFVSEDDSLQDYRSQSHTINCCKCCAERCSCRFPHCNFHEYYDSCPFCCWITCLLLGFGLLVGIFITVGFLSR